MADINAVVRQLLKYKVTSNMGEAMRIADGLVANEKSLSAEDREFRQLLLFALSPQEIMSIGGTRADPQIEGLKQEIAGLHDELKNLREWFQEAPRKGVPAESGSQANAAEGKPEPKEEQKKKLIGVGYGGARQEFDPAQFSVEKMFYRGNKR